MVGPRKPPAKAAIAELEPFDGLDLGRISVVRTAADAEAALAALREARVVGFDTEAKPTFRKGQQSDGPHVLQFATLERAYIFQASAAATHPAMLRALGSPDILKVGFGLSGDFRQLASRFGIRPAATVDLDRTFRKLGYRDAVGAKSAIAILFGRRFDKSKSITTSNWAAAELTGRQLAYAANDAYAALRVHHALAGQAASRGTET